MIERLMVYFSLTSLLGVAAGLMMMGDLRADTFGTGGNQFAIDFVVVTNAGNANDAGAGGGSYSSPNGGVGYNFRVSTYEISQDMITKATAGGLANVTAGVHTGAEPAAGITWYEAAAFVNWLNESKGYQKAYDLVWTGSTWTQNLWSAANAWTLDGTNLFRHKDACYVLPSEDEWYKAAYHQNDGVTANYWDYPTGGNGIPVAVASGTGAGTAVYDGQGDPADVDQAGGLSAYGTMGQGGNVWEWMESAYDGINDSASEDRGIRGGRWSYTELYMRSSYRGAHDRPDTQGTSLGFRVAAMPRTPSLGVANTTGNDICLTMNGNVGLPHSIEVSDNLTNWQPWVTVTLPSQVWSTNIAPQPDQPRLFWRARLAP